MSCIYMCICYETWLAIFFHSFFFLQIAVPYYLFSLKLHYIEEMEKCVIKVLF